MVWMVPVDTASLECESMVEKEISFILCLGTTYEVSSIESVGNYSVICVDGKSMSPKI